MSLEFSSRFVFASQRRAAQMKAVVDLPASSVAAIAFAAIAAFVKLFAFASSLAFVGDAAAAV